ncbi:MAG TPA: deoxyribonuclease IV [Blastocatellia bacterium]|nr:deoxyribonuclease IV [Blastocatellia bacterium]
MNSHSAGQPGKNYLPRLGVHTGISGGLHNSITEAKEKGCQTWQIFSRNPRGWTARPLSAEAISAFRAARAEAGLAPCVIHSCYLINLAASAPEIRGKSIAAFRDEIERGLELGADYLVVHPGSARGAGVSQAIENCAEAIREASAGLTGRMQRSGLHILIENTAGQGEQIGRSFEQVSDIIAACAKACPEVPVGMCLDTAHSFAAGYDWRDEQETRRALKLLDSTVGFDRVKAVHFNDSKSAFQSQVDRHWHIGLGEIGSEGLARILNHPKLRRLPFILETPQDDERDDAQNLAAARELSR